MEGCNFSITLVFLLCFAMAAYSSYAQNSPQDYLDAHNAARAEVGVGPMTWDDNVASYAQNYANQRIGDCALMHSQNGPYGENIFTGSGYAWTGKDAVAAWVGEKADYDYSSNTCTPGKMCGHYTQVIWRDSIRLGCARVQCNNSGWFITCNYDPPGNVIGRRPYDHIDDSNSCANSGQVCGQIVLVVSSSLERRGCVVVQCNNDVKHIPPEISLKHGTANFLLWKTQVLPILRSHSPLGFIDGTLTQPDSPPELVAQWLRLDQMELGWLLASLFDSVLSQVVDKVSAYDVWQTLEILNGTQSWARIQQLKTELQSLTKGTQSIHQYIQHAKSLSLALASAGKPVDDGDLILWTLHGLTSDFDPIVAAINSRLSCPTYAEVCGLLLDFEIRLTASSVLYEKSTALSVSTTVPMRSSQPLSTSTHSQSSSYGRAHNRGRRGGCQAGRGRGHSNVDGSSKIVCYRCGFPFHKANHCFAPDDAVE